MLPDSPECAALRADMKGDRLNSRFQHIHENKSVKAHWVARRIGYHSGQMSLFKQILINGDKISTMIGLCWANDYKQPNPFYIKKQFNTI